MDDLYAAITRIQQLEAEVVRLTNENKTLRKQVSSTPAVFRSQPITKVVAPVTETNRFCVSYVIDRTMLEAGRNDTLRETIRSIVLDRLLSELGPMLYRDGFISNIQEEVQVNFSQQSETLLMTATLKISR